MYTGLRTGCGDDEPLAAALAVLVDGTARAQAARDARGHNPHEEQEAQNAAHDRPCVAGRQTHK